MSDEPDYGPMIREAERYLGQRVRLKHLQHAQRWAWMALAYNRRGTIGRGGSAADALIALCEAAGRGTQ